MDRAAVIDMNGRYDMEAGLSRPNAARMYDYYLGGSHNFAIDRDLANQVIAAYPDVIGAARANRSFLGRAVRYALSQGILQFLDLGCGIPTVGNLHQIVHTTNPGGRIVSVDVDPIAVANTERLLADRPIAGVIHADLRDTDTILDHDLTSTLFDFAQPICLLAVSVLHFVDGDIHKVVATLRERMYPGSLLVISHLTNPDPERAAQAAAVTQLYARTSTPIRYRTRDEVAALFTGFDLVPSNPATDDQPARLVPVDHWRPEPGDAVDRPVCAGFLAGVGHKPGRAIGQVATGRPARAHDAPSQQRRDAGPDTRTAAARGTGPLA